MKRSEYDENVRNRTIEKYGSHSIKHVIFYSDSCAGQNKNRYVATALLYSVNSTHVKDIVHKFLTPGHTGMEVDSAHSCIERAKKHVNIFTPNDWQNIVRLARRSEPYQVIPLEFEDFYDFKSRTEPMKTDTAGNPVRWKDVESVRVTKAQPCKMFLKFAFDVIILCLQAV